MNTSCSRKQLREFGFLIGLGLPIFIGFILPALSGHLFRSWTLWVGIPFLFIGITKPLLLLYPYKFWMQLGHILGWINSRIILGIIFIILVQPIAFIMRTFGYDPLRIKFSSKNSYREKKINDKTDLTRIF